MFKYCSEFYFVVTNTLCTFITYGWLSYSTIYNSRLLYFLSMYTFFTANIRPSYSCRNFALYTLPKVPSPIFSNNTISLFQSITFCIVCAEDSLVYAYIVFNTFCLIRYDLETLSFYSVFSLVFFASMYPKYFWLLSFWTLPSFIVFGCCTLLLLLQKGWNF